MTDVRQAKPIGNQELDTLAVKLACGVLEQIAGLIAGEQDGPPLINDERGVRRVRMETFRGPGGMLS
jgi:hypothetical protein